MAERLAYLEAVVGADVTQFRKGMRDIRNEVGFLSETVRGITGVGRSLTFAYTTPVLALGTASLAVASQFEASMYNINAIANLTGSELDALGARALEFGARTRSGANAAVDALYTVYSAGLTNTEDAFTAMEVATYTAEAGLADITTTTEALIAVMLSYGDTTEETAWKTSDAITQMVAVGVGDMQTFATSLGSVIPTASFIGMSFNELAGDMAFLTQRGLTAARAGTALNAMLEQLVNPTEAMQSAFQELGARGLQDLVTQFGDVNGAVEALIETADGDTEELFQMFNSRQARRAIGLFAGDLEGWNGALEEFYASVDGATMRAWDEQMSSFSASWDLLTSAVESAGIAVGQTMFPVLQPLVDGFTDLVLIVTDTSPELLGMATAFVSVSAVIPPLLWLVGSLITPFGVLVGAVGAVAVAFANDFGGIATSVQSVIDDVIGNIQPFIDIMQTMWDTIYPEDASEFLTGTSTAVLPDPYDVITVTEPTSLWDIYVNEGYQDHFSWDAFMERALEGGWDGEAITPASDISLDLSGTNLYVPDEDMPVLDMSNINTIEGEIDPSIWGRISQAIEQARPAIEAELGALWQTFSTWVDVNGGRFLQSLTNWFTVTDGSTFYSAFTNFLQGNFTEAIDTVVPNMGTNIANAIGSWNFTNTLPRIQAGLSALFDAVGTWITETAIPVLSQSTGFLSGQIGVYLTNAVSSAMSSLASSGGNVSAIMSYIQTAIISPFTTGFSQAIEGTAFEGMLTSIGDGITNLWNTLSTVSEMSGLDGTWGALTSIGNAITGFMNDFAEVDTSGLETLGQFLALFTGGILVATIGIINGLGEGLAVGLSAIGDGIIFFVEALADANDRDFEGLILNLGGALINFGFALLQVPASLIDGITTAINNLTGMDLPSISAFLDNVRNDINSFITGDYPEVDMSVPLTLTPAIDYGNGIWSNTDIEDVRSVFTEGIADNFAGTGIEVNLTEAGVPLGFTMPEQLEWSGELINLALELSDFQITGTNSEQEYANRIQQALSMGMSSQDASAFGQITLGQSIIYTADGGTIEMQADGTYSVIPPTGGVTITDDVPIAVDNATISGTDNAVLPEGSAVPTVEIPEVNLTPLAVSFADDIIGGATAESITNDHLLPIQEAWNTMFATDGSMALSFGTFSTGVATGWDSIGTAITSTLTTLDVDVPASIASFNEQKDVFNTAIGSVVTEVDTATTAVQDLSTAIAELMAIDTSLSVDVNVTGSSNPDGSHKAGLDYVPRDGYLAELHKGERVLTASEATAYREGVSPDIILPQPKDNNKSEVHYNTINVNGAQDVDGIIREMKRKGIKL